MVINNWIIYNTMAQTYFNPFFRFNNTLINATHILSVDANKTGFDFWGVTINLLTPEGTDQLRWNVFDHGDNVKNNKIAIEWLDEINESIRLVYSQNQHQLLQKQPNES